MQCWDRPGGPLGKDGDAGTGRRLGSREGMSWGSQRVQEKEGSKERRKGGWEEHTGEKKSTLWRHLLMHRLPPSPRGPPPLLPSPTLRPSPFLLFKCPFPLLSITTTSSHPCPDFIHVNFFSGFSSVQPLSHVRLFATPWTAVLSITKDITKEIFSGYKARNLKI